ncbi:MAG: homogentisate 1,2-dioxygenase [Waddliaceae bacterium]|nr:homogentisate 1,2-dioxygenase [Waddliaceae bacterium]
MHRYHSLGTIPQKRHTIHPKPEGGIYYEELKGNKGFSGPSSLLYHIHRPTSVKHTRLLRELSKEKDPNKTLRMRHLRTQKLPRGGCPFLDRHLLMFNQDVALSLVYPDKNEEIFYRNAQADEVVYVSKGRGQLESIFGTQPYREGDYIVIPRGILHRYKMDDTEQCFFVTEASGEVSTPRRYRNEYGQLIERSPYSERDFGIPQELITVDKKEDTPLLVKHHDCITEVTIDHHPFDVVGWDGHYFPYTFNILDFEAIVGRTHEPPTVHQTFQMHNAVICSFVPRPYDFDEEAIPSPYHHANVMSDEVIYYAKENFMSRKGVEFGSVTLHPDGMVHGPHPGKTEESIGKKWTDELAVMVDTFYPLHIAKNALSIEDDVYEQSWLES